MTELRRKDNVRLASSEAQRAIHSQAGLAHYREDYSHTGCPLFIRVDPNQSQNSRKTVEINTRSHLISCHDWNGVDPYAIDLSSMDSTGRFLVLAASIQKMPLKRLTILLTCGRSGGNASGRD